MSSRDSWETPYTASIPFPSFIERNRDQVVDLSIYRDGALVAPVSGSYTLIDANGDAVVSAAAVSIVADVAQYAIPAATLPDTLQVGDGWQEEWALTFSDSVVRTFRRSACLVLRALYPVVTDADLLACYTDLDDLRPNGMTSYQGFIDESWRRVVGRLVSKGSFPFLILEPWALREYHLETTLALIFSDFGTSVGEGGRYIELSEAHKRTAASAWRNMNFIYDADHNGKPGKKGRRVAAEPVIYLSNAPRGRWGH